MMTLARIFESGIEVLDLSEWVDTGKTIPRPMLLDARALRRLLLEDDGPSYFDDDQSEQLELFDDPLKHWPEDGYEPEPIVS